MLLGLGLQRPLVLGSGLCCQAAQEALLQRLRLLQPWTPLRTSPRTTLTPRCEFLELLSGHRLSSSVVCEDSKCTDMHFQLARVACRTTLMDQSMLRGQDQIVNAYRSCWRIYRE